MNKKIIRAYLWQKIIIMGFMPSSISEQDSWIYQFNNSLRSFWENYLNPENPRHSNGKTIININHFDRNILIEIEINNLENFSFIFYFFKAFDKEFMWSHHVDHIYFSFPINDFLSYHNRTNEALLKIHEVDMISVLDGLLFHPVAHQHIELPMNDHNIRIGGGICNPYLFLFHLRYQLCPCDKKRESEKQRLVELFSRAIKEKKNKIPFNELMEVPK
jgi:hypothetical protein